MTQGMTRLTKDGPVTLAVLGAGNRGNAHADFALQHPDRAQVAAVAEPRADRRALFAKAHGLDGEAVVDDWRALAERPRFADAVVVATQDAMHAEPMIAFAEKGYAILLEKPMAPSEAECRRIAEAAERTGVLLAVCHVLRYTPYTRRLKALLSEGVVGEIVDVQHLEPVGYWHIAHSYVRGNWRREDESSSMLLAKSCHDLDWIRHVMEVPCEAVQSFGSLRHFRPEARPEGAADRCLDCPVEATCPYSAKKIYLGRIARGETGWPLDVLAPEPDEASITRALREGPYGRCVYACDNDVVDHQTVNLRFEGGRTATFTMMGFTKAGHRKTRIFGTRGEIEGDGRRIRIFDFLTDQQREIDTVATDGSILGGHGGGDYGLMDAFVDAVARSDASRILSGPAESLETHCMVFAAERSRHEERVVSLV